MAMSLHEDKRVHFDISERRRAENALRRHTELLEVIVEGLQDELRRRAERQALLLEVTSDLIRASEPGELGRVTFEHISSAFGADICFNYRLDPTGRHLRLEFARGIPLDKQVAAQSLQVGQAFCGTAAGGCQALVADKRLIASDPKGAFMRDLGATAYACHPLMASDGRVLGTFSVASTMRESFTADEVAWLGTITNFLAQAWERFEAEQSLRTREERLRLSQKAAGLGHWDYDFAEGTWVWSEQTRKLLGVEPAAPASAASLFSRVYAEDRARVEEQVARSTNPHSDHSRHLEFRIVMPNGVLRWLETQSRIETSAAGTPVRAVGVIRDITERKHAEELLRRQADLLDQSHDAIFTWKIGGGIAYWSRGAEVLYGYTPEEAIGRCSHELLRTRHPVPIQEIEAQIAREGSWYGELTHITREGHAITVESRHVRVCYNGEIYALESNRDITARKHAEEQLRKSEERFRSSLLHSPLPILLFDDREQILAISQSWLDQTGYSRGELRRIADWTARAYDERSGEVPELIHWIIPTEPEAHPFEGTIRTKDGRERLWSFVTSAVGAQSDGRRLFVCVAQDVTERKAHEEQVRLLMREVNHRAKNILSVVDAIAHQTAIKNHEDFLQRFSERIRALAANQDLLVRNEWQGVDVEEVVRAQLAHFADLVGSRIAIDGPKLRLNATAAQAIGLALHELTTNAGKYGALSRETGRIDICWSTDRNTLTMSWTERDGPPVSAPKRRGFGSTVVDSMAKLSVGGKVELDYAPSGLAWRLTCPAANAIEPLGNESNLRGRGKSI